MLMADISKMVADRTAISRTVLSSIEVHGADVSAKLSEILFPKGAPKQLTTEAFLKALHGALAESVHKLTEADLAHAQELADDDAPRAARDAALADVRERLISLRATFASVYGAPILKAYGLAGETPSDPELLLNRANNVAALLSSKPISAKPKQEGVTVDAKVLASGLTAAAKELQKALNDVRREEREGQLTRRTREEAAAVWSGRYQSIADAMTGIYSLVGRADLAELVRPTARRRAGLTEDEDVNAEETGSPPADTPAEPG
jgi:hypothetical protein